MLLNLLRAAAVPLIASLPLLLPACGLRLDDSVGAARRERAERPAAAPGERPSYGEMRQARALAMAEAEIIARGGNIRVTANGAASQPDKVRYVYSPGALTLSFTASKGLNRADGTSHALAFTVYHLSDRAGLDMLRASEEGRRVLMSGERFDASVLSARTVFVQPGAASRMILDRVEGGRYVALAAGYHHGGESGTVYVTEYGIGRYSTGGETILHRGAVMFQPLPLVLDVVLGDDGMSVFNNDGIYHYSQKAVHLSERQMHQILYKRNRVSGDYFDFLTSPR